MSASVTTPPHSAGSAWQGPTHGFSDFFAGRAEGILLGVQIWDPDFAAQGPHWRGVDHPLHHRITSRDKVAFFGLKTLENNVGETVVVTLIGELSLGYVDCCFQIRHAKNSIAAGTVEG